MWFLVAISIGAATSTSGTVTRYPQLNQVSQHQTKNACQIAAAGVKAQVNDFAEANNAENRVRLICVQGDVEALRTTPAVPSPRPQPD